MDGPRGGLAPPPRLASRSLRATRGGQMRPTDRDDRGAGVVIMPEGRLDGSAMQQADGGVRDLKLISPETGFDAMTLCLGLVEIAPGRHSPLHRHRCEEVYY